jgi:hypothetical protein
LASDGQEYDCQTCVVWERVEGLDPENREAWQLFGSIVSRLTLEIPGVVGPMFAKVIRDLNSEDAIELVQRLSVIYDTVIPPKPTP